MTAITYLFGIVSALAALVIVVAMLRRRRLRERHAVWWIVAALLALIVGIFPAALEWASKILGISIPANLIFFVSIAILFFVCLQQASDATKLESQSRDLAERLAIQEVRIRLLEDRYGDDPAPRRADPDQRL